MAPKLFLVVAVLCTLQTGVLVAFGIPFSIVWFIGALIIHDDDYNKLSVIEKIYAPIPYFGGIAAYFYLWKCIINVYRSRYIGFTWWHVFWIGMGILATNELHGIIDFQSFVQVLAPLWLLVIVVSVFLWWKGSPRT